MSDVPPVAGGNAVTLDRRAMLVATCGLGLVSAGAAAAQSTPPPRPLDDAWTRAETIPLWPGKPPGSADFRAQALAPNWPPALIRNTASPYLKIFRPTVSNGRAVMICPGGSYVYVAAGTEGLEVAQRMTALGYVAFVLCYRLPGEGWLARADVGLQDAQRALRVIKARAPRDGFGADRIGVLGVSAGGHLAATLATGFAELVYPPVDGSDRLDARPAAAALVSAVITMSAPYAHGPSRDRLLGAAPSDSALARRSPERHVTRDTPPTFVMLAFDDPVVSPENSLMMVQALRVGGRPVELHGFQEGGHSIDVGHAGQPSSRWIEIFDLWFGRNLRA